MSARRLAVSWGLLCVLGGASGCSFDPNLSRFSACADDGACPPGFTCLAEERLCLPDCGAQGPCFTEPPDASTDAGTEFDGGTNPDGGMDGGMDAGTDPTMDAGVDGGVDAGEPLSLETEFFLPGIETVPYTQALSAHGGTPPYVFRATEELPPGLTLSDGELTGTPPSSGTFRVTVEVEDQASPPARVSQTYDWRVRPLLRVAGPGILMNGYLNTSYREWLSATGGTPPYLFELKAGSQLPSGISLSTAGEVTGSTSQSVTRNFQVMVTDSDALPQSASRQLSVNFALAPLLMTLSTQSVPDGRVGTPYHYVLKVSGGATPTWKLEAGTTPAGIGFNAATGTLQGTPLQPGVSSFTISATAGLIKDERTFTLTVY